MPRLSKDSAPNIQDFGPAIDRNGDLDDTAVSFVTIKESHSLAPLLRGPGRSSSGSRWALSRSSSSGSALPPAGSCGSPAITCTART